MIPYDIDPSLHAAEPSSQRLDDGFTPPAPQEPAAGLEMPASPCSPELAVKSDF